MLKLITKENLTFTKEKCNCGIVSNTISKKKLKKTKKYKTKTKNKKTNF